MVLDKFHVRPASEVKEKSHVQSVVEIDLSSNLTMLNILHVTNVKAKGLLMLKIVQIVTETNELTAHIATVQARCLISATNNEEKNYNTL